MTEIALLVLALVNLVFGGWWWWRSAQRAQEERFAATLETWGGGFARRLHEDIRVATREAAGEASRASARETERELRAVLDANARDTRAELAQTLTLMQQTLLH